MKFGSALAAVVGVLFLVGCGKGSSSEGATSAAMGTTTTGTATTGTSTSTGTAGAAVKPNADLLQTAKPIGNPQLVGTYKQDIAASMSASEKADPNAAAYIRNNQANLSVIVLNADGTAKFTGTVAVPDGKGGSKPHRITLDAFLTKDGDDQVMVVKVLKPAAGAPKSIVMQVRSDDNGATIRVSPRGSNGKWDYFKKVS